MNDLIRQAIAAEADERVDSRTVLANLHKARKRKPFGLIVGVATLTAAAAAAAVIVPTAIKKTEAAPPAVSPTPSTQNVLLLGTDNTGRADAIVLAQFRENGSVIVVSLPRDTEFQGKRLSELGSPAKLVEAAEYLTGWKPDHYASIKMSSFGAISQAVGGVEVCLSKATSDPYSGADFPAGKNTLMGDQALAFLRQRFNLSLGDGNRDLRHLAFLAGLGAKITKDNAVSLAGEIGKSIEVDAGWDVVEFARRFQGPIEVQSAVTVGGAFGQPVKPPFSTPPPGKPFVRNQDGEVSTAVVECVE
ncbi:LCP family protein [Lentzea sp. HUAS TT2]|uniref:LCP family protein n=1 Tax=Lentzea sp. HUAS TT2 TaxID=3447454 RepID=UPI003F71E4E0